MKKTHYGNLQVTRNASQRVIRAAYKTLPQEWHPDKYPDSVEKAEAIMKIINKAYKTLSDPILRKEHDRWISSSIMKEEKEEKEATPKKVKKIKPLFLFLFFILPAMGLLAMIVGLVSLAIEKRESQTLFFHGVECIHDCSGHISGFQWAKRKKIINSNNCTGNSQSFIEGCKIYVKDLK